MEWQDLDAASKVGFPMSWVKHLGGFLQNGSALELDGKPLEAS